MKAFYNQWLFLVPLKGGRWHVIPQLAIYTTYIPLIYCQLGDYMPPTTFYGNQKQPLIQTLTVGPVGGGRQRPPFTLSSLSLVPAQTSNSPVEAEA